MRKHAIISYNLNPDYIYAAPIVMWAWKQFGWDPVLMFVDSKGINVFNELVIKYCPVYFDAIPVKEVDGYRTGTVAQVSRLYAACALEHSQIMTADADMIPLTDYWKESPDKTVYGSDLTGYKEYPICYISMESKDWFDVMQMDWSKGHDFHIKRDLESMPNAKSDDFYEYWGVDQQLITRRLTPYNPLQIIRGQYPNGYAVGRVDRGAWSLTLDSFIDCHLFHQIYHKGREQYFAKMMELLQAFWPDEDFQWVRDYTKEFKRLTGHD